MTTVSYSQLRPTLKTGDLLLFQGDDLLDWMIQLEGDSPYNHVGMIVVTPANQLCFWDAPGGGEQFPDPLINAGAHPGARGAYLDALLAYYMSGAGMRLYCRQISPAITQDELSALNIFINLADGTPFPGHEVTLPDEFNLGVGLALSYALGDRFNMTICDSYFCAQLVAQTYMSMGWLSIRSKPSNAYSPASFGGAVGSPLTLLGGHVLSDVVEVDFSSAAAPAVAAGG